MAKNDDKTPEADKAASEAAKAQAAAEEQTRLDAEAKAAAEATEGLVKMHKDGEHLHVHPTTVDAHKSAGWKHA